MLLLWYCKRLIVVPIISEGLCSTYQANSVEKKNNIKENKKPQWEDISVIGATAMSGQFELQG